MNRSALGPVVFTGLLAAALTASPAAGQTPNGSALFDEHCASCHFGDVVPRALAMSTMRSLAPEAIVTALTTGAMREQGAELSAAEHRAVAEFVTGRAIAAAGTDAEAGRCATTDAWPGLGSGPEWNGWGGGIRNRRFQTAEQAGLAANAIPRLTLTWAFGFPDAAAASAQPTVVGGRLFVGSQRGEVYALDAATGCTHWSYAAKSGVRSAMTVSRLADGRQAIYFGDSTANVYALDAATGALLWVVDVDDHEAARITGAPTYHGGRLYVPVSSLEEVFAANPEYACCTFRGSVVALDAATGQVAWKSYAIGETPSPRGRNPDGAFLMGPSGAAIWSAPTIDVERGFVYAATGNAYTEPAAATSDAIIAFDLETGAVRWSNQLTPGDAFIICRPPDNPNCPEEDGPDFDFGSSPVLVTMSNGRDLLVIGQKSGVGYGLDPDREGAIVWQYRVGEGSALGGIEWGFAVDDEMAYFANSDYLRPQPGGLAAVRLRTGELVWYADPQAPVCDGCRGAQLAAVTAIPGAVFSGAFDGAFRAYASDTGAVIWEYDTNGEYDTVNGVEAKGGSINGPGAVVVDGMVYVSSGYATFGGRPGNVLLAFGVVN